MPDTEGLTAVLLQLAGLARQVADLEHHQTAEAAAARGRIDTLTTLVQRLKADVATHEDALTGLLRNTDGTSPVPPRDKAERSNAASGGYQPAPQPELWKPGIAGHDAILAKLRAWVEQIYRPEYGHLASGLGECWDQHPLCLYLVDWLSELWSVLYLQPARSAGTLAGQAEYHTRLLPAAAAQLTQETRRCDHVRGQGTTWQEVQP